MAERRGSQSVAVRWSWREKEIRAFEPWNTGRSALEGRLPPSFEARLVQWQEKNRQQVPAGTGERQDIVKSLDGLPVIGEVEKVRHIQPHLSPAATGSGAQAGVST
jgi:hypothetical protein